jgi:hypothetical protein
MPDDHHKTAIIKGRRPGISAAANSAFRAFDWKSYSIYDAEPAGVSARQLFNVEYSCSPDSDSAIADSKIRGLGASEIIVDDEVASTLGMTISNKGTLTVEQPLSIVDWITKASQIDITQADPEALIIQHNGGMATTRMKDGRFRKSTLSPGRLKLRSAYDGKKKGVILQFALEDRCGLKNARLVDLVEIPMIEIFDAFGIMEAEKLISAVVIVPGRSQKETLYSEQAVAELSDFGVF